MAQSLSDIILHIVFSTKDRNPWIDTAIQSELNSYICTVSRNLECPVIQVNGVEDHIHILLLLSRTITVSKLINELKSNSSRWIKTKGTQFCEFAWQGGYGAFSVSRSSIDAAISYIQNQKEHHKKISFKEEFLKLLKNSKVPYDEKYLWD